MGNTAYTEIEQMEIGRFRSENLIVFEGAELF
jgi:hypothetical protein